MHKVRINKQCVAYKRSPNVKELLSPKSPLPGYHLSQREVLGSALPKFFSNLKLVQEYTRTVSFPRPTLELAENTSSTIKWPTFHLFLIGHCELHGTKYFCLIPVTVQNQIASNAEPHVFQDSLIMILPNLFPENLDDHSKITDRSNSKGKEGFSPCLFWLAPLLRHVVRQNIMMAEACCKTCSLHRSQEAKAD